jgi:hypothetical protein
MKKRYFLLFFIIVFAVVFWLIIRHPVKEITPVNSIPTKDVLLPDQPKAQKDDLISVDMPLPDAQVSSPLIIKGQARGNWFFEGSFPITLTNWDGLIIAQGHATAQGDWMKTEYVPFTASIDYTLPAGTPYRRGFLILHKDNPSGESKYDDSLELPVQL